MNALTLSRGLGWFSIALGAAELFGGRRLAWSLGMEHRTPLFRLFGLREILVGLALQLRLPRRLMSAAIFTRSPRPSWPE